MKASKGMRISSTVPYGYKKIEGNKEQWYIDEPAAEIVRKIFNLCISGKGPSQIARQLEAEKVLTPTAYFNSVGKKQVILYRSIFMVGVPKVLLTFLKTDNIPAVP